MKARSITYSALDKNFDYTAWIVAQYQISFPLSCQFQDPK